MMLLLYNFCITVYGKAIAFFSSRNPKAKKWVEGRKNWRTTLENTLLQHEKRVWMHCASLGEFEQGRSLLEQLKQQYPDYKLVLSFFSPSGYEVCKDDSIADYVFYLPLDTKSNAAQFIDLVNPSLVIFVKYEFWYHYLNTLKKRAIPVILISAAFRKDQVFFKWYGGFFRKLLKSFTIIFVQKLRNKLLLHDIGVFLNVQTAGDTRYDRVISIAATSAKIPLVELFIGDAEVLMGGSTWEEDEKILKGIEKELPDRYKMIIAPHEIGEDRIQHLLDLFPQSVRFSALDTHNPEHLSKRVLIIDNIGMLSGLYRYAKIAMVGGGFQRGGIHNILEPAVYGVPVFFGPAYHKFMEAIELVELKYCFSIQDVAEARDLVHHLVTDETYYQSLHKGLKSAILEHSGATDKILQSIREHKWV